MADNGPPRSPRSVSFPFRTELPPASLPSPPSLSDLPAGGAQPTETTSTVIVDAPLVSADPIPDLSPPATVADDPRDKYEFFTTPLKENPKPYAYDPLIDKQRGPVLVNKSGMGPRFRELPVDEFLKAIHKASPTDEQRKKFEGVDLSGVDVSKFKEKDWYPLLVRLALIAHHCRAHMYLSTDQDSQLGLRCLQRYQACVSQYRHSQSRGACRDGREEARLSHCDFQRRRCLLDQSIGCQGDEAHQTAKQKNQDDRRGVEGLRKGRRAFLGLGGHTCGNQARPEENRVLLPRRREEEAD